MVTTAPLGIVDTLSAGFATVNKRLWLLLLPLLLDLLLVFGPGVSFTPAVDAGVGFVQETLAERTGGQGEPDPAQEGARQALKQISDSLAAFRGTNLLAVLAWQLPSLISATSSTPLPKLRGSAAAEVASGWGLLGAIIGLALLSLLGVSFYFAAIAQALGSEAFAAARLLRSALRGWLSFCLFFLLLLLCALPGSGAAALFLAAASLFGPPVLALASSLLLALVLTLSFYLFFVDDAIFVAAAGPLQAAWWSANVVWRNFWSALGFILLVNLIQTGIPLAWKLVMESPFGLAGAMVGQAYIATGLTAAGMIFFSQRHPARRMASPAPLASTRP